jgi:FixJ family two-component response regulator
VNETQRARIHIVDDDASVRSALCALLGTVGLETAAYASAEEFLAAIDGDARGCLLLDVRMPGMSGLDLQRVLHERGISLPVIVLTGHGDVAMAVRAMKAGAADFVEKPFNGQALIDRIRECLYADAASQHQRTLRDEAVACLARLSAREREVLELLVSGKLTKVIAADLGISDKTVDVHRSNIMRKTRTRSVAELVRLWLRAGEPGRA